MKPWNFVHINDMQPGSPRSYRFRPAHLENQEQAYRQIADIHPDWILIGGDLTRDGSIHDFEFVEAKERLDALNIPYRTIPGNMDSGNKRTPIQGANPNLDDLALNLRSEQLERFQKHFGTFPWTFVHRDVRFTGFYEAVAGSGLPEEEELWRFLEALADEPRARNHIIVTHYPLFMDHPEEPNYEITDPENYKNWYFCIDQPHRGRIIDLLKRCGVDIVLSGHIHCRRPVQVIDGIRYYKTAAPSFGQMPDRWPDGDMTLGFYRFEVSDGGIQEHFVPLEKVSQRKDFYGLGGHPKPEERDYSLACDGGAAFRAEKAASKYS